MPAFIKELITKKPASENKKDFIEVKKSDKKQKHPWITKETIYVDEKGNPVTPLFDTKPVLVELPDFEDRKLISVEKTEIPQTELYIENDIGNDIEIDKYESIELNEESNDYLEYEEEFDESIIGNHKNDYNENGMRIKNLEPVQVIEKSTLELDASEKSDAIEDIESIEENNNVNKKAKNLYQIEKERQDAAAEKEKNKKVFGSIEINKDYIIPHNDLNLTNRSGAESWQNEIKKNSFLLTKTLDDFGIESKVVKVNRGPVVTLYEMQIAPGIKVNRIVGLSDDIAMALAASRVRVVAPIPGKSAVGVEVPNKDREMVTLGDIIKTDDYKNCRLVLKVALGKDVLGNPVMIDLKKQPHLLIAGATGAGKSVCVNTIISSLVYNYDPSVLRFIMIDPKMVELQLYNGLPHQLCEVITEPDIAPKALKWAILEMERRYRLLSENTARDIETFNRKMRNHKRADEMETLPYVVIIIDELADLMMVAPKEIENYITRIAQKARAVGIHLIIATQRPSVDVITGIIKANFPARIAFQVAQKNDSRTIIDRNGAEKLLGKGDMLYQSPLSSFPVRIQGAFVSEDEIEYIVDHAKKYGRPHYIDIEEAVAVSEEYSSNVEDEDEMFVEALKIIEETRKASASYLQRRLCIGYNRAARIIERMEELGYIGPPQGSKPREVLI